MITLKQLAEMCHVSIATVSNVLNGKGKASEETVQQVLRVAEETGYKPNYAAQTMRGKKTNTIAVIAEDIAQFTSPAILESIMSCCEENGYRVIVQNLRLYARWADGWYNEDAQCRSILEPALQELRLLKADGLIYLAGHARIVHVCDSDFPIPTVVAYAFSDSEDIPSVGLDDISSACEVTRYLIGKGHKNIGVVCGREENMHTRERLKGYKKGLEEAGIEFRPEYIHYGDWSRETARESTREALKQPLTAIMAFSDQMCGGVYDVLYEQGIRIPEDMSVTGFDDQDMAAYFTPPLTTTKLSLSEIGRQAAELLVERLADPEKAEIEQKGCVISIPCDFVERSSVKSI